MVGVEIDNVDALNNPIIKKNLTRIDPVFKDKIWIVDLPVWTLEEDVRDAVGQLNSKLNKKKGSLGNTNYKVYQKCQIFWRIWRTLYLYYQAYK